MVLGQSPPRGQLQPPIQPEGESGAACRLSSAGNTFLAWKFACSSGRMPGGNCWVWEGVAVPKAVCSAPASGPFSLGAGASSHIGDTTQKSAASA